MNDPCPIALNFRPVGVLLLMKLAANRTLWRDGVWSQVAQLFHFKISSRAATGLHKRKLYRIALPLMGSKRWTFAALIWILMRCPARSGSIADRLLIRRLCAPVSA